MDDNYIEKENALKLEWIFGFNNKLTSGVHNLSAGNRCALFYASAHSGVIYDTAERTQTLLQGHKNPITATAVSNDKRYIVTGDTGTESLMVIWDANTGTPLKTFFDPSPTGVGCLDISSDGRYIVSISAKDDNDSVQTLSVWDWTAEGEGPICVESFPHPEKQVCVRFDPWNNSEILTNGTRRAFFWSWTTEDNVVTLQCQPPKLQKAKFGQVIGIFTASTFLVGGKAVTGTVDGDVVVWDSVEGQRAATKLIRLGEGALTVVTIVRDQFLCLAGEDGAVRFYDMHFRLEAWFEDMEAGAITSVSFARDDPTVPTKLDFTTPHFIVGTRMAYIVHMESALFEEVDAEGRRGTLLVQGMSDEAHGVAMHPTKAELAIACYSGGVYLWDYVTKVLLMARQFDSSKLRPRTICYDPSGTHLLVGFTSGVVKLLDPSTLQDSVSFKNGRDPVTLASFSPRGDLFATADSSHHVYIHRLLLEEVGDGASTAGGSLGASIRASWCYIGRYRSHSSPIVSLQFGLREGGDQGLFSIGEDKYLVEYDLETSSSADGVCLVDDPRLIEQEATPTAGCWHPLLGEGQTKDFEDRIVSVNDEYKVREWNADSKSCRRTTLGPTFGGPINILLPLAPESPSVYNPKAKPFVAYASAEKVIGLCKMPFDGNPAKGMGIIAHPGMISSLCSSGDATMLATAGGADCTVNLWSIHTEVIDEAEASSYQLAPNEVLSPAVTTSVLPYVRLLEGGADGSELNELVDFFYYAQLRTQGEDTTAPRDIRSSTPLSEIRHLMSAMGHYPSEVETANMVNEVKYSAFTTMGVLKEEIDLEEFIKLLVNHRPVVGFTKDSLEEAFKVLSENEKTPGAVDWKKLKNSLTSSGEALTGQELSKCLEALVGAGDLGEGVFTADEFIQQILGFEENTE